MAINITMVKSMSIQRIAALSILGLLTAAAIAGCSNTSADGQKPNTLAEERKAVQGGPMPADAGARFLAANGSDPNANQGKMNAQINAFQNKTK